MTTLLPVRRVENDLWDIAGEMDRLFDSPFEVMPQFARREGLWHPTVDIYNRPDEMLVELELPGVKMEDLDLRIEESHLILEGTRKRAEEYKTEDQLYSERMFGSFHRVIHLPSEVDADRIEARLIEGLLVIRLPKVKRTEGKKIDIKVQ